jgi:hypothetical protein
MPPPRQFTDSLWITFLIGMLAGPALADAPGQLYTLEGSDAFRIPDRHVQSRISYDGIEQLTFAPAGNATIFHATVTYKKNDGGTTTHQHGAFELTMSPSGDTSDEHDDDPDYLTILNQPFSIQLDAPTMHDLHGLTRAVPFDFPSPMTGAPLHGTLRRLSDGTLDGRRVLGIAFSAQGPLQGTLPDKPSLALNGRITMNGTAYYAYANALLLALDATLLIEGTVAESGSSQPVTITYTRSIRPAASGRRGR